ncbi:MAG: hypothetical protein GF329_02765 [Candidatus Lokiarchaeota archaeon]|nr:hypothetical protein [Candidatus Lokiarchaeota archaeon]
MDLLLALQKIIILNKTQKRLLKMVKRYSSSVRIKYPPSEKKLNRILKNNFESLTKKVPKIKKIILFGSYSRKKPHYGSDVDLLIIVDQRTDKDFEIIYETLYDISTDFEWSPLIITEERFNELKKERKHFFRGILSDGIAIFDGK